MDTYMQLRVYSDSSASAEDALDAAEDVITGLEGLLSPALGSSEVHALNTSAGRPVAVSDATFELLSKTLAFSASVGSSFDCTLYPVSRAWGFTSDKAEGGYRIPTEAELAELLEHVDDGLITLDSASRTVLLPEGSGLELGAVAKGYAGDAARLALKQRGVTSALLDMGSSTIVTIGHKPEGGDWRIALRDPENPEEYAGAVTIGEGAVSTSGGYERYFTDDEGGVYWHILDPITGAPAKNGVLSVTVLTEEAFLGDALSTALFVMGAEEAVGYWRTLGGFEFIIISEEGILATEGAADVFTPLGAYMDTPVKVITHED